MNNTISPLAFVSPEAKLGEGVTIHPFAYVDKDVVIDFLDLIFDNL